MPKVTIIIPVFNKQRYLSTCLASVTAQTMRDIEVICIDDKSTDESLILMRDAARHDRRIQVLANEVNMGAGVTRNRALRLARGEFVQFTDADDVLPYDAIENLYACAVSDSVGIVRGSLATVEGGQYKSRIAMKHRVRFSNFREMWIPWWHPAFLISTQIISLTGATYPTLRAGEDPVFLSQIFSIDPEISSIEDVTYCWRERATGISFRNSASHLFDYIIHAKLIRDIWSRNNLAKCWTEVYRPFIIEDIRTFALSCQLSETQTCLVNNAISELEQC
jgi:glycosyltransferase involved in cell wall biosynthesis